MVRAKSFPQIRIDTTISNRAYRFKSVGSLPGRSGGLEEHRFGLVLVHGLLRETSAVAGINSASAPYVTGPKRQPTQFGAEPVYR